MATKQYEDALAELPKKGENQVMCFAYMILHRRTIKTALQDKINGGWQDISTAPKDVPILGCSIGTTPITCFWDYDKDEFMSAFQFGSPVRGGCYYVTKPTHWQPLPQPPGRITMAKQLQGLAKR